MENEEIVLVEDNEDDATIALRALKRSGEDYNVRLMRDGRQALEWVRGLEQGDDRVPKVIFLDLRLPQVPGREVLQALRRSERTRLVPVVVISSSRMQAEVEDCYRLGANSFITKKYGEKTPGQYIVDAASYWLSLNRAPS